MKILKQLAALLKKAEDNTPVDRTKRNPSYTKKGPGRRHAGSKQRFVRGYTKHYTAGHQEPPKNAR